MRQEPLLRRQSCWRDLTANRGAGWSRSTETGSGAPAATLQMQRHVSYSSSFWPSSVSTLPLVSAASVSPGFHPSRLLRNQAQLQTTSMMALIVSQGSGPACVHSRPRRPQWRQLTLPASAERRVWSYMAASMASCTTWVSWPKTLCATERNWLQRFSLLSMSVEPIADGIGNVRTQRRSHSGSWPEGRQRPRGGSHRDRFRPKQHAPALIWQRPQASACCKMQFL
jgi:hypothetical protein